MVVFLTGATGYIGSAVVRELLDAGHKVVGLSRSARGAGLLKEAGAEARLGDLDDLAALRSGAEAADGVIHLAFNHGLGLSDFAAALKADLLAVQAMGGAIEGSGKPFVVTNHMNGEASEKAALGLKGARAIAVGLSPSVHDEGDHHGFVPRLISMARAKGFSAYVGDGSNRWPAVHRLDAASLYRLALEKAPNGSRLSGRGDEGVPFRDIAEVIGRKLGLPARSIAREEAEAHFGFLGRVASTDIPASHGSSEETRKLLGWRPVHPGLIADLEEGHYFRN
jgi:nucleoside-diphosphate-sugar epimerase